MSPLAARIALGLLAVQATLLGVWAALAPRAFYDEFPGFGTGWVALDGPYNEHLVRDFGALNLAIAATTIVALVTLQRLVVMTAAIAWLVWSVPHLVYHLRHADLFPTADRPGAIGGLALNLVLAGVLLWLPVRPQVVQPVP